MPKASYVKASAVHFHPVAHALQANSARLRGIDSRRNANAVIGNSQVKPVYVFFEDDRCG